MVQLLKCIECGKSLSSELKTCIHCRTEYPFGIPCGICGKKVRESKSTSISKKIYLQSLGTEYISITVHSECYAEIQNCSFTISDFLDQQPIINECSLCKSKITLEESRNSASVCKNCGHKVWNKNQLSNLQKYISSYKTTCCYCDQELHKKFGIKIDIGRHRGSYAHKICLNQRRQEENIKYEEEKFLELRKEEEKKNKKEKEEANEEILCAIGCVIPIAILFLLIAIFLL